jgi:P4 family phage/plasmid primase-like protien
MIIPTQLQKDDFRFIKLDGKKPVELKWNETNNYVYNDSSLTQWSGNIGVATGFGNLLVVDFDSQKAVDEYMNKLPNTFTTRTANKKLPHLYYILDQPAKTFHGKKQGLDLDLQCEKAQVVCAGSVLGDSKYEILNDIEIAHITAQEIADIFGLNRERNKNTSDGFKDESRSGQEWGKICEMIRKGLKSANGLDKDEIFLKMKLFSKWNEGTNQYRERTWEKALEAVNTQIENAKTVKSSELTINSYVDNVENFYNLQPFFYDKNGLFWLWDIENTKYLITDEVDIMDLIDKELKLNGQTVSGKIKMCYIDAFKRVGRRHIPKDPKKTWVQYKDVIVDAESLSQFPATPEYLITNPIPWEIGESDECPIIDKLFTQWVGEQEKVSLYEILAYCTLIDYPIHRAFVMLGSGSNGKGSFQTFLTKFIGKDNVTSTELDYLTGDHRFEAAKLFKKNVCLMGETNCGTMSKTSMIKKLTGQDMIGYEIKNKNPFNDYNYAKLIINSNSMPTTEDTTDGFFRRWFILNFPNTFKDGKDITKNIIDQEFKNLAKKSIKVLHDLLERGDFTRDGTVEERKKKYIEASNPFSIFMEKHCDNTNPNSMISYNSLYKTYSIYLTENKHRVVSSKEFKNVLSLTGLEIEKTTRNINGNIISGLIIFGLDLKKNDPKPCKNAELEEFC